MHESTVWGVQRFTTLIVVMVLHLAFLALFLRGAPTRGVPDSTVDSIEVMVFPPTKAPKVRFENAQLQRLTADTAISVTLPGFSAPSLSPPAPGTAGDGSSVNWAAEAHRAVQAFEIRRNHPPTVAISGSPSLSDWWPREHRAGDRYKTDNGDWIVWISANCYQVATATLPAVGSAPARTLCVGQTKTVQEERSPVSKKLSGPEG